MVMKYEVKSIIVSGYEGEVQKVFSVSHKSLTFFEAPGTSLVKITFLKFVSKRNIYLKLQKDM